jgi:hypothetical protein
MHIQHGNFTAASLDELRDYVRKAVPRVRELGNWPAHIDGEKSLVDRVPSELKLAPGFDAGLACALDMIPRERQKLAATLHAAYTEAAVEQIRTEWANFNADTETCWWLVASSLCKEEGINVEGFAQQLHAFEYLAKSPVLRATTAGNAFVEMRQSFQLVGGIPFVIKDGGLQGAYVAVYDWGVQYIEDAGIFFIGTFRESLGLHDFPFSKQVDEQGRAMSGPVHGSRQFVKTCSLQELESATFMVRNHLGPPKK